MSEPRPVLLADYAPPPFLVESLELEIDLHDDRAEIRSRARYRRNPEGAGGRLELDGELSELVSLRLDGRALGEGDRETTRTGISLDPGAEAFELEVETRTDPAANASLMGLYRSGNTYCTQCEAEGFRKITFFPDRPDVMTVYRTRISADRARFPVLLANGNPVESGELEGGRHFAVWEDPFKKPSYLFAMVAGDLGLVEDRFRTRSGRDVTLRLYVDRGDEPRAGHAMESLKKAMAWDEEVYGREYDLDLFMIVAVSDFNFGAMENKGLNIFNSALVLASPDTATDADYQRIEGVVAHEYFHNWSGNRVTCRDWFQLSLKEGFTVFRDQSFSADQNSAEVQRISDVRYLRTAQFAEDAGPTAHPVRPESYLTIDNFYTLTIYEKGAEIIRMMHRILGPERFRRGSDLYFSRHDGQAVTTDDFVAAMEEASGEDLGRFRRWYGQAGTPVVKASGRHDAAAKVYELTLEQHTPPTPGQPEKQALRIPVAMALLDPAGCEIPLRLEGEANAGPSERVLSLEESRQVFRFVDVAEPPRPSLLRGFSAPVKLELDLDDRDLAFLAAMDGDGFNRWEAGQRLALRALLAATADAAAGREPATPELLVGSLRSLFDDPDLDPALFAEAVILPSESWIGDQMDVVDPDAIHAARRFVRRSFALAAEDRLVERYESLAALDSTEHDAATMGRRALKNACLAYLAALEKPEHLERAWAAFVGARTMTDEIATLGLLAEQEGPRRDEALARFHDRWKGDALVMNKWLAIQAASSRESVLDDVVRLREHAVFDERNPNKVRSLYGVFARNQVRFHAAGGAGYRFLADRAIALDSRNPQLAAQLAGTLKDWRRFDAARGAAMRAELERIAAVEGLSRNTYEIATKSLGDR